VTRTLAPMPVIIKAVKIRKISIALFLFLYRSITSQYCQEIKITFVPCSTDTCQGNHGKIELNSGNLLPPYGYEQIGLIFVEGPLYEVDDKMLSKMKYVAWQKGADAIVNLSLKIETKDQSTTNTGKKNIRYCD
jgi:hypothetical protein